MILLLAIIFVAGMVAETFLHWGDKIIDWAKEKTKD